MLRDWRVTKPTILLHLGSGSIRLPRQAARLSELGRLGELSRGTDDAEGPITHYPAWRLVRIGHVANSDKIPRTQGSVLSNLKQPRQCPGPGPSRMVFACPVVPPTSNTRGPSGNKAFQPPTDKEYVSSSVNPSVIIALRGSRPNNFLAWQHGQGVGLPEMKS